MNICNTALDWKNHIKYILKIIVKIENGWVGNTHMEDIQDHEHPRYSPTQSCKNKLHKCALCRCALLGLICYMQMCSVKLERHS